MKTRFKPTETFQYTEFTSCHPPGVKKGFIKGEVLRLLHTNSSRFNFEENIAEFKRNLIERGYPEMLQYCAKVMQAKCPSFVLCSRELSTKVRAKVRAKIRGVFSDNSLEQRAIFRRIFGTSQKIRDN